MRKFDKKARTETSQISTGRLALEKRMLELRLRQKGISIPGTQTISRREETGPCSLSFAQERLWFLDQWAPGSAWYNIPLALRLEGSLDVPALEWSLGALVQRHEVLRTAFEERLGRPVQVIAPCGACRVGTGPRPQAPIQMPMIDLRGRGEPTPLLVAERDQQVSQLAHAEAGRSFDLAKGPLLRVYLLKLDEQEHVLLFTLHHIVTDDWSMRIVVREITTLYQARMNGEASGQAQGTVPTLPELPIQYADYALWQREVLQGKVLDEQIAYWRKQLANLSPLELPTDHLRPAVKTNRGASQSHLLPKAVSDELLRLCQKLDVTLFMLLLASFQVLLMRYTGQRDISVGTPIANRRLTELEGLIGFFVNTLVMHTDLGGNPTFLEVLRRVREVCLGAYANPDIPFEKVVQELEPERDMSRTPLFQVMLVLQNAPERGEMAPVRDLAGVKVIPLEGESTTSKFDLTLSVTEVASGLVSGGLNCVLEYSTDLFEAETIRRMLAHFKTLLEGILQDPQAKLSDLPLLTDAEREQLLVEWNATQADYPQEVCLHQLFEQQVERTPEAISLVFEEQQLTYQRLNGQANQLAHCLLREGIGPDVLIGVCMERSLELVVALLAVLKAGGAYVPLDPGYPQERLTFLLEDAQIPVVLTQAHLRDSLPPLACKTISVARGRPVAQGTVLEHRMGSAQGTIPTVPQEASSSSREHTDNPHCWVEPENLAYVIYTSGSTGQPKGVQVTHANVSRLFIATADNFHFQPSDVWTMFHSFAFDFSVWEIWGALLSGGRLVVVPYWLSRSPDAFWQELLRQQVTILSQTPSAFKQLMQVQDEHHWSKPDHRGQLDGYLRAVVFGGEALALASLEPWVRRYGDEEPQLINMYGITETTVHVTYHRLYKEEIRRGAVGTRRDSGLSLSACACPIGQPLVDLELYVLDRRQQLVPIGVTGEVYVGGAGLARGYLNRPDLTAERFVPHPFVGDVPCACPKPGARLYRTGDLARYRETGELEYLGRIDSQVKLRGFRIELGEIEATLRGHSGVRDAVVVLCEEDEERRYLAAYVVPQEEQPAQEELRNYLREQLPDYMVPAIFVSLETLPLTSNGKVNRKALPFPARTAQSFKCYVAPQSEIEQRLSEIWQEVLGVREQVSTTSNFFDLGGHSLLLIQVARKLHAYLGYEVPVVDLFRYPTIHALSAYLSERQVLPPLLKPIAERVRKRREEWVTNAEGIAIVGLSGRFSGARNIDEFWQNLCHGVESISFFSAEELLASGVEPKLIHDPRYVKAHGILDDVESFDAAFFGYSPKEASLMDPQQRLFLECAWEVLEQAGYDADTYQGLIGVYAGQSVSSYLLSNVLANPAFLAENGALSTLINNAHDYLATRTSYKLNLKGPSITIQTACSTSLVAVHMACQGLLRYECDMALAGGASIAVPQKVGYLYEEEGIFSPDGHCRAFDADACGTVAGSGVGIVALKRLSDATADGDTIYAVIRGSAINNDGAAKVGYTAPSVEGQVNVIAEALAIAGVEPESISYVETHGTGTALGDPIEIAALTQAFRASSSAQARGKGAVGTGLALVRFPASTHTASSSYCAIGSLKSNLGHLDAAAGIAGLIKTVLALKHGMLPPSLHFHHPNPKIDFAKSPFYVNTHLTAWKRGNTPRRAGVSAFGIGGTNAHVILEEVPPLPLESRDRRDSMRQLSSPDKRPHLMVLSAKTASALETMTEQLAAYVKAYPDAHLADIAYTLQIGRKSFPYRRAFVAQDRVDMLDLLSAKDPQPVKGFSQYSGFVSPETKQVAFLFPGQGTQYVNMGRELYEEEPTFRDQIDTCAKLLVPHLQRDLREVIYLATEQESGSPDGNLSQPLHQTDMTQPALFVIEYALAQLLMEWGVHPQAMIGHSIGEYVAACLAGVFSLEDALALVALRGRLMQALPIGAMLSVMLPEKDVEEFLGERLTLAAWNGANESVVSGTMEAIELLEKQLTEKGISYRRLHTSHAFHSQMMDPILERFTAEVSKIALHPPKISYISNITGTWITDQEATNPAYWVQHIRQTVRWASGVQLLLDSPSMVLLEVGPGHSLSTLARRMADKHKEQSMPRVILPSLRHPQTQVSDRAFLLNTCGRLWCTGVTIDWSQLYADEQRQRIPLPTYPFERERYWISPVGAGQVPGKGASSFPTSTALAQGHEENTWIQLRKEPDLTQWFSIPSWKRSPLPTPTAPARKPCWLIFTDTVGLGTRLGEKLREWEEDVITVCVGTQFRSHWSESRRGEGGGKPRPGPDGWEYTICPDNREDYDTLLKDIGSYGMFPTHIVHLWTVIATDHVPSGLDYFETAQALGFYSLLFLTQALGKQKDEQPQEIAIISNNLQEVIGREVLCPARATALGIGKIAPYEYPHISFRSIDIVLPGAFGQGQAQGKGARKGASPFSTPTPTDEEQLFDQMIAELRSRSSDMEVAYRGPHRWVRYVEPVQLEKVPEEMQPLGQAQRLQGKIQGLRQQGVYLITGGLGGIGLALAEDLAKRVKAKLVLTGRTTLPAREEWDHLCDLRTADPRLAPTGDTASEQDAVVSKIRQVKRLEELGAEVLVIQADVTDLQQMHAVVSQVRQCFGELHGVIHTAGIFDDGLIQMRMPEVAAKVLAPKVKGTLVLETVLKDEQPDFIILCSSLAALIGELGRVDYCAANTFLDSFAFYHTAQQRVWTISINWDGWQEVGMAVNGSIPSKKALQYNQELQKRLQNGILPQEGVEVFRRIIAHGTTSQVIVSTSDILARLRRAESFLLLERLLTSRSGEQGQAARGRRDTDSGLPLSLQVPVSPPSTSHQRPNLQTAYVAPQNETQQQIADLCQKLLGIEKIGIHDNFLDLGGHSLLGMQLITRLRDTFQVDIPLRTFFEEPTVAHLAIVIVQKMAELVDETLLLQDIEDVEHLTDDEAQTVLTVDTNQTGMV